MEYGQMSEAPSKVRDMPSQENRMRRAIDEYWANAAERAREAAAYADQQVHHNPWTAVGISFGVGMVVGALVAMLAGSQRGGIQRML